MPAPTPAQLAAAKRRRPYASSVHVFEPTGRLNLVVTEGTWDIREWQDTKDISIEQRLNDVIVEMLRHAVYRREQALENERRREREAVVSRMRERQTQRVNQLSEAAQAYQRFTALQAFGAALRATSAQTPLDPRRKRWLRWAELQIAQADPVLALLAPRKGANREVGDLYDDELADGVGERFVDRLDD